MNCFYKLRALKVAFSLRVGIKIADVIMRADIEDSFSGIFTDSHDVVDDSMFRRYLGNVDRNLKYEDFNVKSKEYKVKKQFFVALFDCLVQLFHVNDFDFKEQGYSLLSRYWHEHGALLLDEEFDLIYNLTDRTFSGDLCEIDTGPFRRAIWHYTFRLRRMRFSPFPIDFCLGFSASLVMHIIIKKLTYF